MTPQLKEASMDKIKQPKLLTLEEANAILPEITVLLKQISDKKDQIEKKQVEIDSLELILDEDTPKLQQDLIDRSSEFNELVSQVKKTLQRIEDKGGYLKDLDYGLVDFFGMHENKVVYYCWKLGESKITHWHEVGEGFASRKPIH